MSKRVGTVVRVCLAAPFRAGCKLASKCAGREHPSALEGAIQVRLDKTRHAESVVCLIFFSIINGIPVIALNGALPVNLLNSGTSVTALNGAALLRFLTLPRRGL